MFMSGNGIASSPGNSHLPDFFEMLQISSLLWPTYWQAAIDEVCGTTLPINEPVPDSIIAENQQNGKIPPVTVTSELITPFCREWRFDRDNSTVLTPTIVIVAPQSGTAAQQMRDAVMAFLPVGNVRLVEQIDPHCVSARYKNGLNDSIASLVQVIARNPDCHVITFSQSGTTGTLATAWMYQNPDLYPTSLPASLTVIGSPINTELAPDSMNWIATHTHGQPVYIEVGKKYVGAGRKILPGTIPKLYFEHAPPECRANMKSQALPAEHINDTLELIFRQNRTGRNNFLFNGRRVDIESITCPVQTFAGGKDRICPPPQTHDLHRLTPNALSHNSLTLNGIAHYPLVGKEVLTEIIVPMVASIITHQKRPMLHLQS